MKRLSTTLVFILVPSVLGAADLNLTPRGVSGLIDMPDAFMLPDAESALSIARDKHLSTLNFTFQALPRLQTSLSFATYDDIGAGVSSENTSLNLKYALTDEGRVLPAISVGINGLFGNDRDAAEYIVASKTLAQTVEASVGLGWGATGGRQMFPHHLVSVPRLTPQSAPVSIICSKETLAFLPACCGTRQ